MIEPLFPRELQLLGIVVLGALLAWVMRLIRAQRLGLRDSLLWLVSTGMALLLVTFPGLLWAVTRLLGVKVPANALFALAILYTLVNILAGALGASRNAEQIRRLAQECALLRAEIDALRTDQRDRG
ncbi:MAG TPA: DUF2304 domain-containing protein [Anaeromyxobacteraceae bacterium]|nr:DUF2304 domain-containing protein [Anaeromyxobacteraceae bacterium]